MNFQIGQLRRQKVIIKKIKVFCNIVFAATLIASNSYAAETNIIQFDIKVTERNQENMRPLNIGLITENNQPTMFMEVTTPGDLVTINRPVTLTSGSENLTYWTPDISTALTVWPVMKPSGKIDTTVIFVKTMKRGRAFVTTSACESIELEVGALNSISADEYVIDITANLINQPADDITSNANTQEAPKKL